MKRKSPPSRVKDWGREKGAWREKNLSLIEPNIGSGTTSKFSEPCGAFILLRVFFPRQPRTNVDYSGVSQEDIFPRGDNKRKSPPSQVKDWGRRKRGVEGGEKNLSLIEPNIGSGKTSKFSEPCRVLFLLRVFYPETAANKRRLLRCKSERGHISLVNRRGRKIVISYVPGSLWVRLSLHSELFELITVE
ncbi:hypothetical protein CEXT_431161 [Caerostris extrusa]|uniref:Uncharacterized protein n=1 Tax=Caerostris extrusa TaxID=172846 RepID=A0AAV4NAM6_CAEEX|nr:hypothetical protein CEXT_431161 [Caerostris extrusa]